jgi:predicted ribosome quality control (RQC) complex YloA/Tae2 family protein
MADRIGVRELKRPVGIASIQECRQEAADQVLREVAELARCISRAWKSPQTGVELVAEQRR